MVRILSLYCATVSLLSWFVVSLGITFYFSCLKKTIYSEFLPLDFLRKCSCLYLPEEGDPVFSVVTQNQYEPRNATESTKSWCPQTRELSFVLVGGFKADIMKVRSISRNFWNNWKIWEFLCGGDWVFQTLLTMEWKRPKRNIIQIF